MKAAAVVLLGSIAVAGIGCGSENASKREPETAASTARPVKRAEVRDERQAMHLDSELGVLETADVEATLQQHFDDIRSCYRRAGKAQRYAEGRVLLRFLIAGNGSSQDVWVTESTLGNYDVERCLVEVGRRITFRAPEGRKATTFDYPVEFRSTNQVPVLPVDGLKVEQDLTVFLPQLAACGQLAGETANAIVYIEPNGFPGSVGLAVEAAMDEDVADCMVQTIRRWKMSAKLPGNVMRATFTIPPVIATAEASPPRRTAGHRRRR